MLIMRFLHKLWLALIAIAALATGHLGVSMCSQDMQLKSVRAAVSANFIIPSDVDLSRVRDMQLGKIAYLDGKSFGDTVRSEPYVVAVITSHSTCPPCRELESFLRGYVKSQMDIPFLFVDRDHQADIATFEALCSSPMEGNNQGIPLMLLYRNGELVDKITGYYPRKIKEKISRL